MLINMLINMYIMHAALTEKGRGCSLHQFLRLIGCQLGSTQQTGGGSLRVLKRVGDRTRQQHGGKQEDKEVSAMS